MAQLPTLNKFRKLNRTPEDYTPSKVRELGVPTIKISEQGMCDREAEEYLRLRQNQANELRCIQADFKLLSEFDTTYKTAYGTVQTAIDTATQIKNTETASYLLDGAEARATIEGGKAALERAKVPVAQFQQQLDWSNLLNQISSLNLQSIKVKEDVDHQERMHTLNGYSLPQSIPQFEMPRFKVPEFLSVNDESFQATE
ncbi:hypothetical protein H6G96_32580 [Nostoc sp. FACHB-892]|uniref:hypothetical protein n=1 Tax=Nostoc sp. FACHB-892 TaxID=2692843 RepID=UPI001686C4AB|nr:hypothetical protein [Nostoc sp. FACHB-892]MBD2730929.1 hypothetical protein [Nostoc sp. FACHB-892]